MSKIKKCPFCGRCAELRHDKEGFSYVLCANDGCYVRTDGHLNDESAIKAWNTRKPMERIVERLEEYRDDFMNDVYEELREDADNCRANRIIDRFDEVTEILKEEGGMNE